MSNRRKPKKRAQHGRQGPPPRQTAHDHGHDHDEHDVWIFTEPTLDGNGYMVTINAGQDRAVTLTPDAALRYAQHLLWICSRAEYDSLVAQQLNDGLATAEDSAVLVAQLVNDLRQDRPELDQSETAPLAFEPVVNVRWQPSVTIKIDGQAVGQWDLPAARRHALGVLEAVHVADLDAGYKRLLTGLVGIEPERAEFMINELGSRRGDPFSLA